jgi:hypothetical protein
VRSLLGFVIFTTLLITVLVFVVVPVVAGPIISGYIQSGGFLQGADLSVDAQGSGPELVTGRVDSLHLHGSDVALHGVVVGDLDVTLHGVSLTSRSFDTVDGQLRRIRVQVPDGPTVTVSTVELSGQSAAVRAVGTLDPGQASLVIREAAARTGIGIDDVSLGTGTVHIGRNGYVTDARLALKAGRLVLLPGESLPDVVLLQPEAGASWKLREVTVRPDGVELAGTLDARAFAANAGDLAIP